MQIPTLEQAHQLLHEAEMHNPGPWVDHSLYAARAAQYLAEPLSHRGWDLLPESAYILGLLHDIGRIRGVTDMRHIMDGYHYMIDLGYADTARICLTHSFPLQNLQAMSGNWDGTTEDWNFIAEFLADVQYNAYDRLIQLCDAIALPDGFCLLEKRIVDVALRRGINELTLDKWKAFFALERDVEQALGASIYRFLPGVVENTFNLN